MTKCTGPSLWNTADASPLCVADTSPNCWHVLCDEWVGPSSWCDWITASVSVYLHRSQPYNLLLPTCIPQPKQTYSCDTGTSNSRTGDPCCEFVCCSVAVRVMVTYTTHVVHLQDKWHVFTQHCVEGSALLPLKGPFSTPVYCSILLPTYMVSCTCNLDLYDYFPHSLWSHTKIKIILIMLFCTMKKKWFFWS